VIINSTNIGRNLSGIGRYSLSLSLHFLKEWDHPFQLVINREALVHFEDAESRDKIKVVKGSLSPDFGLRGHLKRLLWTNRLGLNNPKEFIFNTSQLEGGFFHRRQILTVHDLIPLIFPEYHKRQYYYFKYMLPIALKNALRILTGSCHTKSLITDRYGIPEEKIRVIPYGINPKLFHHGSGVKRDYILYVGRVSPTKNINSLIKAFELLIDRYKLKVGLKITGRFTEYHFNMDEKLRENVEFLGNVSDKELPDLYRRASLLVFPSFYEGYGFPPLEAMACGCPVVVSHVASLPEVCGDAAYYVDPYSIESIAEGMYQMLTNETLRQSLINKGLERAKRLTWERSAQEHIRIFEEVLSS
jgi:glycosyltransferase involved in cell wall biosynthesis